MSLTPRACVVGTSLVLLVGGGQVTMPNALADDPPQQDNTQPQELHNVTYRARIDGVSRGALVTYKINDTAVQTANPTMLPGRTFEANSVLADPHQAGMQVSIQWPYSANLHCEILVDDATTAQADQFIGPRLTPAHNDPNYGVLQCGAPAENSGAGAGNMVNTSPVHAPAGAMPAQPAT